ncbi:MAG: metallophosphoesterase [Planctomycetaceae bacterium]|jgi:hypothetical protein|nr:metallophosphoesterase [Planctomycetaceae bacterium]
MPITLPPLNRRSFVKSAIAFGIGGSIPSFLFDSIAFGETVQRSPECWILASDTHVSELPDTRQQNAAFQTMVRDISQLPTQPTGMIISGDCAVLQGKIGDYKQIIEYLKPLRESGIKIHAALGNHDNRQNFLQAFPEVTPTKKNPRLKVKAVRNDDSTNNTKQVDVIETKHANWFILDSLAKTNETPGSFGKQQLTWLADELDARREKPALIIAHHNPDVLVGQGLLDTADFAKVIQPRPQVKAYIYGHTHFWGTSRMDNLHIINLPSTAWLFNDNAVLAWVVATLHEKGITLELKTIDKKDKRNNTKVEINYDG